MYMVSIKQEKCNGCGECISNCPVEMLFLEGGKAEVNGDVECMGCETCVSVCETGAVNLQEF